MIERVSMGVDPDIKSMPVAVVVNEDGRLALHRVHMIRVDDSLKEDLAVEAMLENIRQEWPLHAVAAPYTLDVAVIENQRVLERKRNHDDMIRLAQVAGAARAACYARKKFAPHGQEWRGNAPKNIIQARILSKLGIEYVQQKTGSKPSKKALTELARKVEGVSDVQTSEWLDLVDAIGLACWGLKQIT